MKRIVFINNVDCDYYDSRLKETYPKYYQRRDSVMAEDVEHAGKYVNIALANGDTIMNIKRSDIDVGL